MFENLKTDEDIEANSSGNSELVIVLHYISFRLVLHKPATIIQPLILEFPLDTEVKSKQSIDQEMTSQFAGLPHSSIADFNFHLLCLDLPTHSKPRIRPYT